MEQPNVYTHALWRVRRGKEDAFIQAWTSLARTFSELDKPPLWGTLLRSATDPSVFYSFGPWQSEEDVAQMRDSEVARSAIAELQQLCEEATPGTYRLVKHVVVARR